MKHLKRFNESDNSNEFADSLNMIIDNINVVKIPYGYYSGFDFNLFVVYGERIEDDDFKFLKELYCYHEILQKIYNLDFYHIDLSTSKIIITFHEIRNKFNDLNYIRRIKSNLLKDNLPTEIFNILDKRISKSGFGSHSLLRGIEYKNGDSGNISLFDWKYKNA